MSATPSRQTPCPAERADPQLGTLGEEEPDLDDWSEPLTGAGGSWPSGPLDAAQRAFDLLTRDPAPMGFDARGVQCLPQRVIDLEELKHLLIAASIPRGARDLVWAQIVTRARTEGPAWVVAAVGMAMPALRFRAGLLTRGWHGEVADLDSELLLGFLTRLKTIDLDAPNIAGRLVEAGARAVKQARKHSALPGAISGVGPRSIPPARPWDHPDLVLARAVAAAVIGPEECLLIGRTRLEDIPLRDVAADLGISTATATWWRHRAEQDLREAITAGELEWVDLLL
jgi:hypothetical protein